ncbi:MAG: hypothetical protein JSS72_03800 [Armatimonadetes bacterium]|nr:hypothetical protein [Armatimonadota bacterium]
MVHDGLASRLPWMILAFLISLGLFIGVTLSTDPPVQQNYSLFVQPENKPEDLAIVNVEKTVNIKAKGYGDLLKSYDPSKWLATVDLSNAKPGKTKYAVTDIQGIPYSVRWEPVTVTVELEKIERKEVPVKIEPIGTLKSDSALMYSGEDVSPENVTIIGPASKLRNVTSAIGYIDLNNVELGKSYPTVVKAERDDDKIEREVRCDPVSVNVTPQLSPAPSKKLVLVVPQYVGQPDPGYEVTSVEVRPNQIAMTGNGGSLSKISIIPTEPILLKGLRLTQTFRARVKVPDGLHAETRTVSVRVSIRSIPITAPGVGNNVP